MKLYTSKAAIYDKMIESAGKHYKDETRLIAKMIKGNRSGNNILDLGCGTGTHAFELIKQGFKVICGDINTEMLEIAKKKTKAECIRVDMRNFKLKAKVNAIICLYNTIFYNKNRKELLSTFTSCYNNIIQKGVLILQITNPSLFKENKDTAFTWRLSDKEIVIQSTFVRLPKMLHHFSFIHLDTKKEETDWHEMRILSIKEIEACLKKCGFKDIKLIKNNAQVYILSNRG